MLTMDKTFLNRRLSISVMIAVIVNEGFCAKPTVLTPTIKVLAPYNVNSDMYAGSTTRLELEVAFPDSSTQDVVIELLPSTNDTIMILGEVVVTHVGSNTDIPASPTLVRHKDPTTNGQGIQYDVRGVYNFGTVTNSGTGTGINDNSFKVEYEAILVNVPACGVEGTHWVSSGVEYNSSYNVWIGQVSYTCKGTPLVTTKVNSFTANNIVPGNANAPIKSLIKVHIEAKLPNGYATYAAEAISLTSVSCLGVLGVKVVSAGSNFDQFFDYTKQVSDGVDCTNFPKGNSRVRHDVGFVVNRGANQGASATNDDLMTFEVTAVMNTESIGEECSLGLGVEVDTTEVWVTYINFTAIAAIPFSGTFSVVYDQPQGSVVTAGGVGVASFNLTTHPSSNTRFTVSIESKEQTTPTDDPALSILSIVVSSAGNNVKCPDLNYTLTKTITASPVYDGATATIDVINTDLHTASDGAEAHVVTVLITFIAVDSKSTQSDVHDLKITVSNVDTGSPEVGTLSYTITGTVAYDSPVAYAFSLFHQCSSSDLAVGTKMDFYLTVQTERNKNPGRVTIEFPVPSNISDNIFSICNFEVQNIGKNIPCVSNEGVKAAAQTMSAPDGTYEKVVVVIDPLCNLEFSTNTKDDEFTIKMTAQINNVSQISEGSSEWYGVGARYSDTQVWVAQLQITARDVKYYPELALVKGMAVNNSGNETFPGPLQMQYSFDGSAYKERSVQWNSGSNNGSHDVYMLTAPVVATYAKLAYDTCDKSCYVQHDFIVETLDGLLTIFNDNGGALKSKFPLVLDADDSTCMTLPLQGQSPSIFLARMNTSLFEITENNFELNVTGHLSCERHGGTRVLMVGNPTTAASLNKFHSRWGFCSLSSDTSSLPNSCVYNCSCPTSSHCSELYIFLSNSVKDDSSPWDMCSLSAKNY